MYKNSCILNVKVTDSNYNRDSAAKLVVSYRELTAFISTNFVNCASFCVCNVRKRMHSFNLSIGQATYTNYNGGSIVKLFVPSCELAAFTRTTLTHIPAVNVFLSVFAMYESGYILNLNVEQATDTNYNAGNVVKLYVPSCELTAFTRTTLTHIPAVNVFLSVFAMYERECMLNLNVEHATDTNYNAGNVVKLYVPSCELTAFTRTTLTHIPAVNVFLSVCAVYERECMLNLNVEHATDTNYNGLGVLRELMLYKRH
ncbi:hypothetical protein J6590_031399 [Homalodisca vitripennis]|nr:hypothetical protein J6590_031399 [Homalodisca vitripennis]